MFSKDEQIIKLNEIALNLIEYKILLEKTNSDQNEALIKCVSEKIRWMDGYIDAISVEDDNFSLSDARDKAAEMAGVGKDNIIKNANIFKNKFKKVVNVLKEKD
jgi:hypothetical protein